MDLRATKPRALFLTDNGCCLCGQHLGSSARFTGRDISGQPIVELTPEVIAAECGDWTPACETCGHQLDARGVSLPLEPDDEREVCHECDGADEVQRIRHSINVEARTIDAARALWGGIIERYEAIATQYRMLKQTYLDEAMFRSLVLDVVAPLPTPGNDSELAQKLLRTRTEKAEARRAKLTTLWTNGTGHVGDGSAWEAYNAVTEATDHDLGVWEVKGSRVQSLLEGRMGDVKAVALASLVEYAETAAK